MRIVLDTKVQVSSLHNPDGTPGRIVDLVMGGQIRVLYDDRILDEYQDVLSRPQLAIDEYQANAVVRYLRLAGERIVATPLPDGTFADVDDMPFAEIATSGQADALVTGNTKHFSALAERGLRVVSPVQFLEQVT